MTRPVALCALWLLVVATMSAALHSWLSLRDLRDLHTSADSHRSRLAALESRRVLADPDAVVDRLATVEARAEQCERRLVDVRLVMETLVRESRFPGRVELPRPISDWPDWPCMGDAIGSITERFHPCGAKPGRNAWPVTDDEAAQIRAVLSKQRTRRSK